MRPFPPVAPSPRHPVGTLLGVNVSQAQQKVATRDAYGDALVSLGKKRNDVVVLDADLSGSTKTGKFAKAFPERFFNIGIAEQDMIGTAAGLSIAGKLPFASTFAVFATGRAWEQVRQSVCYPNLNVKIVASHAGITVGEDGGSHQSVEDIALMRVLPNMTVIVPADGPETLQAIEAVAEYKGPCYVRVGRNKVPTLFGEDYKFKIGKAHVFNEGKDAAIIAAGLMVAEAIKARDILKNEGIDAGVINMSTIKPIDADADYRRRQTVRRYRDRGRAFDHRRPGRRRGGSAGGVLPRSDGADRRQGCLRHVRRPGRPPEALRHVGSGYRRSGQGSDEEKE